MVLADGANVAGPWASLWRACSACEAVYPSMMDSLTSNLMAAMPCAAAGALVGYPGCCHCIGLATSITVAPVRHLRFARCQISRSPAKLCQQGPARLGPKECVAYMYRKRMPENPCLGLRGWLPGTCGGLQSGPGGLLD